MIGDIVLTPEQLKNPELRKALLELERRKKFRVMDFFTPYPKQLEFIASGKTLRERLLMAANQVGKTQIGAYEVACHLTGQYPKGWKGRTWDRPTKGWICGLSASVVRDIQQKKLCGEPGVEAAFGTGMIPKEFFVEKPTLLRGVADTYDTIQVRHKSGGISVGRFKSYEQGRAKFQAETLDWFWDDEEPELDIYLEQLTRITATGGMGFVTFTPINGLSNVVIRFLNEPSVDRGITSMTIEDAEHIKAEDREKIIAGYAWNERDARAKGIPMLGSGAVFQVPENSIACKAFIPPLHWPKIWGFDFGIGHPFAGALLTWDRDADCIYVIATVRMKDKRPIDHAAAVKPYGSDIPIAWPKDGADREAGSGEPLSKLYKAEGLKMLADFAQWPDGSRSTEAGIQEMGDRMTTGRFKVFDHLTDWWDEFRMYHRKDGKIVKLMDDLMSATRVGVMMKRSARVAGGGAYTARTQQRKKVARGVTEEHYGI